MRHQSQNSGQISLMLIILTLANVINYMDRFALSVLAVPIRNELGFSDTQIGILTGFAFALLYALCGIPLARIADRGSRRMLLTVCLGLWSVMTMLCGAVSGYWQMLIARMGVGVGEAGGVPASHSLLGDCYPPSQRAFAIGIFQSGTGLGLLLGIMLSGLLAHSMGWRWTFVLLGLPGLVLALVIMRYLREPARGGSEPETTTVPGIAPPFPRVLRTLLTRRSYKQLIFGYTLGLFGAYGILQWTPAFLSRSHGLSLDQIGLWYGMAAGLGLFSGMVLGAVTARMLVQRDRRWEVWIPGCAYVLCVPVYFTAFLTDSASLSIALLSVGTLIASSGIGPGLASVQTLAEPRIRATAIALGMFVTSIIGQGGGPFVIGVLSDAWEPSFQADSLRFALIASLSVMVWSALHFYLASRSLLRDAVN